MSKEISPEGWGKALQKTRERERATGKRRKPGSPNVVANEYTQMAEEAREAMETEEQGTWHR